MSLPKVALVRAGSRTVPKDAAAGLVQELCLRDGPALNLQGPQMLVQPQDQRHVRRRQQGHGPLDGLLRVRPAGDHRLYHHLVAQFRQQGEDHVLHSTIIARHNQDALNQPPDSARSFDVPEGLSGSAVTLIAAIPTLASQFCLESALRHGEGYHNSPNDQE
jgi:hypothetical protein